MKIPASSLRGAIEKKTAGRLFVDREEPVALLRRTVAGLPADGLEMIVFYGMGGQGKSALCRHIRKLAATESDFSHLLTGMVDLRGRVDRNAAMSMLWVRNALADGAKLSFPTFDIAFTAFWNQSYPDQNLPTMTGRWIERIADLGADSASSGTDFLVDMAGGVLQSVPFVGMAVRSLAGFAIRKTAETFIRAANEGLRHLYDDEGKLLPATEIERRLPYFLACDIGTARLKNPDSRILVLVDEYECLLEGGGTSSSSRGSMADEAFRLLVQECAALGVLFIFFSRERLPWDRIDPAWNEAMTDAHHLLGGLGDIDADRFLAEIPVDDPDIRKAMISGAKAKDNHSGMELVYPYMLDLQVDHFLAARHANQKVSPSDFTISDPDFVARRNELLRRFLKYCDDPLERTLKFLSVLRAFDRDSFAFAVRTFSTALSPDRFEDIVALSFVEPVAERAGTYAFHGIVAEALQAAVSPANIAETRKAFARYFMEVAYGEGQEGFDHRRAQALRDAVDLLLPVEWSLAASAFVKLYFDIEELSSFPDLLATGKHLLDRMPASPGSPELVSGLLASIGCGMAMTGDYASALSTLDRVEIISNDAIRLRIAIARTISLMRSGRISAAVQYGQRLLREFSARKPGVKLYGGLAELHRYTAHCCHSLGRLSEASRLLSRGEALLGEIPADTASRSVRRARADMASIRIDWKLYDAPITTPETTDAALRALDRIKSIYPDPTTPEQVRAHLIHLNQCSRALVQEQKSEAARAYAIDALDLARKLAKARATATWDTDLVSALAQLANIQDSIGNRDAAVALAREAREISSRAPAHGSDPSWRMNFADTIAYCAQFENDDQHLAELATCIGIFSDLADKADGDEKYIYLRRLAELSSQKGRVLFRSGDHAAAMEALDRAEEIWRDLEKKLPLQIIKWGIVSTLNDMSHVKRALGEEDQSRGDERDGSILAFSEGGNLDFEWEAVLDDSDYSVLVESLASCGFHGKGSGIGGFLAMMRMSETFSHLHDLIGKDGAEIVLSDASTAFCNTTRRGDVVLSFGGMNMPHPALIWDLMIVVAKRAIWAVAPDDVFPAVALGRDHSANLIGEVTEQALIYTILAVYELKGTGLGELTVKFTGYADIYEALLKDITEAGAPDAGTIPDSHSGHMPVAEHIERFCEEKLSPFSASHIPRQEP